MRSFMSKALFGALLAAGLMIATQEVQAGGPCGYGYFGYGGYSTYTREYIPYFAQHPPVYYSQPVARPYGYSPYAYPPGTLTPEPAAAAPKTIMNPFHKPKTQPAADTDRTTQIAPLRIVNPYFLGEASGEVQVTAAE
jgi:hypothetical protein